MLAEIRSGKSKRCLHMMGTVERDGRTTEAEAVADAETGTILLARAGELNGASTSKASAKPASTATPQPGPNRNGTQLPLLITGVILAGALIAAALLKKSSRRMR
jgi:hypothetical protein